MKYLKRRRPFYQQDVSGRGVSQNSGQGKAGSNKGYNAAYWGTN